MEKINKFTDSYKNKLKSKIKDLTTYLEKTGYKIKITVILYKAYGYLYSVKVSTDNEFTNYATWALHSTGKTSIKKELLANIIHFDWKHRKHGGTTRITKTVKSTALKIECCNCWEEVNITAIHRNVKSDMFKSRNGYVFCCHSCTMQQFSKLLRERDLYTAMLWICCAYDRKYDEKLINQIKVLPLSPAEMAQNYFRRLNLQKGHNNRENLFVHSKIFDYEDN